MTRKARFTVRTKMDRSFPQEGTVIIDRAAGLISVRPARRRRLYTLPLDKVATWIVQSILRAEAAEVKAAKAARRKFKRRAA